MESSNFTDLFNAPDCTNRCVKADFDCLLAKFKACDSLEFPAFTQVWRGMKMSMISAGKMSEREARQFAEECLMIIVPYFHQNFDFAMKTGIFYLMYSFYSTQGVMPKSQIRLTIKDWAILNKFIEEAISKKLHDVEFIFHKLCASKAFLYVAPPNESHAQYMMDPSNDNDDIYLGQFFRDKKSPLENIFNKDSIEHLSAIHDQYQEMKCILSGVEVPTPDCSVNMLDVNTATVIDDLVKKFMKESQHPYKESNDLKNVGESWHSNQEISLDSDEEISDSDSEDEDNCDTLYQVVHDEEFVIEQDNNEEDNDDDDEEEVDEDVDENDID